MWILTAGYKFEKTGRTKSCFCIGPEKCNDKECNIVKEYNKYKKKKEIWWNNRR